MAIIASTLGRIKADPLACLGGAARVNQLFAQAGHRWRKCLWDPAATLGMSLLQVLHENTAITDLRLLGGPAVKESTYCDARMRLPVAAVARVVEGLCGDCSRCMQQSRSWLGRRVFVADATSASTPDEPALQDLWPQPAAQKAGCGFPAVKLLGLLDLATGMIVHLAMMCLNVHEMSQLGGLHGMLEAGDVLLADRGFCSFMHVAMLLKSSVDAVFRMHQRQIVDFTPNRPHRREGKKFTRRGMPASRFVRRLGREDQVVAWARPKRPGWMSEADYALAPEWIEVRELRYRVAAKGRRTRVVTVVTTLLDPMRYPKREVADLYGLRWRVETNFRHLKTSMKMEHLKCRTADGVLKELMVFVLVYNLIRAAMVLAGERQGVDPDRISFVDTERWLRAQCTPPARKGVVDLVVNPMRPDRWSPRVIKRRIKPYDRLCTTERKIGVLNKRGSGASPDEPAGFPFCGAKPIRPDEPPEARVCRTEGGARCYSLDEWYSCQEPISQFQTSSPDGFPALITPGGHEHLPPRRLGPRSRRNGGRVRANRRPRVPSACLVEEGRYAG